MCGRICSPNTERKCIPLCKLVVPYLCLKNNNCKKNSGIRLLEKLGSGQFGQVCKGLWKFPGCSMEIAVKTLKPNTAEEDTVKFLQEAAIMGQFSHPNVVKLYGVVTVGEPVSGLQLACLGCKTPTDTDEIRLHIYVHPN